MDFDNFEIDDITSASLFLNGDKFMEVKEIKDEDIVLNSTYYQSQANKIKAFPMNDVMSAQLSFTDPNVFADTIKKLCETYDSELEDWHLIWEEFKQCRTHRKRRINKKWAKRYGTKYVLHDIPIRTNEVIHNGDSITMKLDVIPNSALLVDMNKIRDFSYEPILPPYDFI